MYQLHVRVVKARVKGVATLDSMRLGVQGVRFLTGRQRVSPSDQYPWARMRKLYCSYDYVQSLLFQPNFLDIRYDWPTVIIMLFKMYQI